MIHFRKSSQKTIFSKTWTRTPPRPKGQIPITGSMVYYRVLIKGGDWLNIHKHEPCLEDKEIKAMEPFKSSQI